MKLKVEHLDPEWAWSPYEPDAQQPWDRRRAAHLFRRAGFAATSRELDEAVRLDPAQVVEELLRGGEEASSFHAQMQGLADAIVAVNEPRQLSAWWLYTMLFTPHPLLEKMTLFWHGHFATSAAKVTEARLMLAQNELLRRHALGDYRQLVRDISRDPAMLIYLDSVTNHKLHPNENYARELMELFCLGEGCYTEADVQELARCFTGWEIRHGKFYFNRYQHDRGQKSLLGKTGTLTGDDAIDWIVAQEATPRFIARKVFRHLITDEGEPSDALLAPLVAEFRDSGLDCAALMRRVLTSRVFFADETFGRKVRSPVELTIGLLRALEGTTDLQRLAQGIAQLGQELFYPPNVKGWDGGRSWINSSTLLGRTNVLRSLLENNKTRFKDGSLRDYVTAQGLAQPEEIVEWLAELLLAVPLSQEIREQLMKLAEQRAERSLVSVVQIMSSLPEYQLA